MKLKKNKTKTKTSASTSKSASSPTTTSKLSFDAFEEEKGDEGPRFRKTTTAEKKVTPKPAPTPKPASTPKAPSPTAFLRASVTEHRHSWKWEKVAELATCSHAGCTAAMHFVRGVRGGLGRYYTIGTDKSQLRTVGPCPAKAEKGGKG